MSRRTTHSLAPRPSPLATHAFTFIEVLFAIIILGIGSIMIAGMLPVAIKQSSDTRNAITGKAACEAGYAYIQSIASSAASGSGTLPDSNKIDVSTSLWGATIGTSAGRVLPLTNDVLSNPANVGTAAMPGVLYAMQSLTGSRVLTSDPRSQWLAFYGRAPGTSAAKLIVLALHMQANETVPAYVVTTPTPVNTLANGFNDPLLLTAAFAEGGALDPDTVTLNGSTQAIDAADTGAFVIVADSPVVGTDTSRPSRNNGRVFRLGKLVSSGGSTATFELQPGYDLPPISLGADGLPNTPDDVADASMDNTTNTQVWLVGRGLSNPSLVWNQTTNPYIGAVQDVGVLTTQVQLSN